MSMQKILQAMCRGACIAFNGKHVIINDPCGDMEVDQKTLKLLKEKGLIKTTKNINAPLLYSKIAYRITHKGRQHAWKGVMPTCEKCQQQADSCALKLEVNNYGSRLFHCFRIKPLCDKHIDSVSKEYIVLYGIRADIEECRWLSFGYKKLD